MTKLISALTLDDALFVLGELVAENEERGERTLIFCEDKVTLLAERAVLNAVDASFLTEVSTFARFLSSEQKVLSKQGSVMAVSSLITRYEKNLRYFRKNAAQIVYETIAQLAASRVDAAQLLYGAEQTDGTLQGKLSDLAFLFGEYSKFLAENNFVDESGYLSRLPERIATADLQNTHVFFFAFPSFTKQGQAGIEEAISCGKDVTGIFIAGEEAIYTNEGARTFRKISEERGDVKIFRVSDTLTDDAVYLQRGLFSPERYLMEQRQTENVKCFVAADDEKEMEIVAAVIKKKIAEGARYRDSAVLVPDAAAFSVVEKVFSAYRIPFFADKKRPFSEHPFCLLLFSVLEGAADGVLPDEADAILSSVYLGKTEAYRNYLLRFGAYRGAYRREIKTGIEGNGYCIEELRACRERMCTVMSCIQSKGSGRAFVDGIRSLYDLLSCEETTERIQESFSGAEKQFLSIEPLWNALDEMVLVAGDQVFSAREFSAMLKSGLDALEISMIPQSVDAVFVGDATDSRFQRVKTLFVTGLTDALPRVTQDTAVISDREIERLSDLSVEISPAIAQVNARAREGLALNVCAFTEELYCSYPLQKSGEACNVGEIYFAIEKLFKTTAMPDLFPFDCCERNIAIKRLLSLKKEYESGGEEQRKRFGALHAALCQVDEKEKIDRLIFGSQKQRAALNELYFSKSLPPTFFEKYFSCPYKGFVENGLRLREREEGSVRPLDTGNFIHNVLQRTAERFSNMQTEEECRTETRKIAEAMMEKSGLAHLADTKDGKYTGERLIDESIEVTVAAYRQLVGSAFHIRSAEEDISIEQLQMKGRVDRIDDSDEYVRVIDYKTGTYDISAKSYYTGQRLQLQLYLKAASKNKIPAGAFYFPAADNFVKEDENKYRMEGFFSGEDEILVRMDTSLQDGAKSVYFDGARNGKYTEKGMQQEDFEAFLDYSVLVVQRAEHEMKCGNIAPSPYKSACEYCKLWSLCGFVGTQRSEDEIKNSEIVKIVKRERGEEE